MGSTKTKKGKRQQKSRIDKNDTLLGRHPWLGIMTLLFWYIIFLIVPSLIYRISVSPTFFATHLYLYYIIDFFGVAILFLVVVPLIMGLPNNRRYGDFLESTGIINLKPVYRTIVLGVIAAIVTLACMLLATFLATLFGATMIFEPDLLINPLYPGNIYGMLKPGIWEEVAFRGIILVLLLKLYSKKTSIIVNGVIFGTFHLVNILTAILYAWIFEIEPEPSFIGFIILTLFQVLYTTFFGFFLAYLFIKTRSVIPCILTHYLVNAFSSQVTTSTISDNLIWVFLIFMTVIGFGILPWLLNNLIVSFSCHTWSQPYDEQVSLFDKMLARNDSSPKKKKTK